jgi:putative ABC transport system permease protein
MSVPLGYDAASTLSMTIALPEDSYPTPGDRRRFVEQALRRLSDQPSSGTATLTNVLPHVTEAMLSNTRSGADGSPEALTGHRVVTPDFFETLRVPVRHSSGPLAPDVVFVDETLARRLWPAGMPAGATVRSGFTSDPLLVGGVVGGVREWQQEGGSLGTVYYHYRGPAFDLEEIHFLIRYRGERAAAERDMRSAIEGLDARLPMAIAALDAAASESLGARRAVLLVVALFSLAALGIVSAGVYAIVSFIAGQRLHEAAIRKALGARSLQIVGTMIAIGVAPALAGILLGWMAWIPASAVIQQLLFRTAPFDPTVMLVSGAALAAASLAAGAMPARRAARVEALTLLRDG